MHWLRELGPFLRDGCCGQHCHARSGLPVSTSERTCRLPGQPCSTLRRKAPPKPDGKGRRLQAPSHAWPTRAQSAWPQPRHSPFTLPSPRLAPCRPTPAVVSERPSSPSVGGPREHLQFLSQCHSGHQNTVTTGPPWLPAGPLDSLSVRHREAMRACGLSAKAREPTHLLKVS